MPKSDRVEDRMAHWPHATEWCNSRLELDHIEPLAVRLLARGLLSQRLVAFVGTGVSAAYGRMTWRSLMEVLWRHIEAAARTQTAGPVASSVWEKVRREVCGDSIDEYLNYSDHTLKAQILANVLDLLGKVSQERRRSLCDELDA